MKPEELESALGRLWAKVAEPPQSVDAPPSLPVFDLESASRGAAVEALALIKRQHREHQARWESTLEIKDADVKTLAESLSRAEAELETLRRRCQRFDARMVEEISALARQLEAAHALMREEESRFRVEEKRLSEALTELEAENRRLREAQIGMKLDLSELAKRLAKTDEAQRRLDRESQNSQGALREAREAVAATLSELLTERQAHELAEERAAQAEARLEELSGRFSRMEKLWQEERRQWGELWERERSGRDS